MILKEIYVVIESALGDHRVLGAYEDKEYAERVAAVNMYRYCQAAIVYPEGQELRRFGEK